jgi:lipoprotein-releasing system permease protein
VPNIPFELFIAFRYLKSRRKTGFINLITYISIFGVAIGVAALAIVLSVMNGFESEVRSRIIGFDTHIRLRTYHDEGIANPDSIIQIIRDIPHITGLSPYILNKGMVRAGKASDGAIVRGADPATVESVSNIGKNIIYGELKLGPVDSTSSKPLWGMVVGRYLAERLYLDLGDTVMLISPSGVYSMFQTPPVRPFVVTGLFETGMYEYDDAYVYIANQAAQPLFRMGKMVSGIEIRLDDLYKANAVVQQIDKRLGFPYFALTWFDMRKNLFSWMQLEKWAMFIILSLIVLVAAFNIASTLIMVTMEKTRDIGILKSMGATSKSILNIFLYEGLTVGVLGTGLGSIIGYTLCWVQHKYKLINLPGDVYFINTLPIEIRGLDFAMIATAAVLIALASSMYPARRAANLVPVEAIRYE